MSREQFRRRPGLRTSGLEFSQEIVDGSHVENGARCEGELGLASREGQILVAEVFGQTVVEETLSRSKYAGPC